MSTDNIVKNIDHAIGILQKLKDQVIQDNLQKVNIDISYERDVKPHYELGKMDPTGFKVISPNIIKIIVSDSSDLGRILK